MHSLEDILKKRRSVRAYTSKPVQTEAIRSMLKAALLSPTGKGIQARSIIVVDDRHTISTLAGCKNHGSDFLAGAPLAFVVTADPEKASAWIEDTSIATITIQYKAEELGLGSCWIQIRGRKSPDGRTASEYIKEALSIPDHLEVETMVAVGHPEEDLDAHTEGELRWDSVKYNGYSRSYS